MERSTRRTGSDLEKTGGIPMASRRWRLIMDFMRGNRLRYVGAIATVALTATIGFLTPRVLGGTVDAIVDHLNGTDNPLNFFGAMTDYLYARGGREYLLARLWLPALML